MPRIQLTLRHCLHYPLILLSLHFPRLKGLAQPQTLQWFLCEASWFRHHHRWSRLMDRTLRLTPPEVPKPPHAPLCVSPSEPYRCQSLQCMCPVRLKPLTSHLYFSRFLLPARNLGRRPPRLAFAYMNESSPASSANDSAVVRSLVVEAVEAAAELMSRPSVGVAWDTPSALEGMTVGSLAAHLLSLIHISEPTRPY